MRVASARSGRSRSALRSVHGVGPGQAPSELRAGGRCQRPVALSEAGAASATCPSVADYGCLGTNARKSRSPCLM